MIFCWFQITFNNQTCNESLTIVAPTYRVLKTWQKCCALKMSFLVFSSLSLHETGPISPKYNAFTRPLFEMCTTWNQKMTLFVRVSLWQIDTKNSANLLGDKRARSASTGFSFGFAYFNPRMLLIFTDLPSQGDELIVQGQEGGALLEQPLV